MKRKIIRIDEERCDGCGLCAAACEEGAIQIVNGKARLVSESFCDGLGACLGECPRQALEIIEREAEPFDEKTVHGSPREKGTELEALPCGCSSTHVEIFTNPPVQAKKGKAHENFQSSLTNWPVKIRLVPSSAPFLKETDLLVAADCTSVAYPDFHRNLAGKAVMTGCPKFDDAEEYVSKFSAIFTSVPVRSITVLVMEVPCCAKLPLIVRKAMKIAGKEFPLEVIIIGKRGEIIKKEKPAA